MEPLQCGFVKGTIPIPRCSSPPATTVGDQLIATNKVAAQITVRVKEHGLAITIDVCFSIEEC